MKRLALTIAAVLSLGLSNAWAGGSDEGTASTNDHSVKRTIKSPRFARPLVERWIEEYAKTEPGVEFLIVNGSTGQDGIDLNVAFDNQQTNAKDSSHIVVYFGETAVLPITARSSEAARLLEGKHLNAKKLRQLYFLDNDFEEDVKKNKVFESITVYSGSNASSATATFARNFGEESSSFRGKRISGDDLFLNNAIEKDPLGVSFNALPNIFDLQTRHIKDGLTIIGIDVKKDLEKIFSNQTTLDEFIAFLEDGKVTEIAVEKIGVSFYQGDDAVSRFLQWVLENGTKFNHEYGLLNLDKKEANAQINKVQSTLTAQK